jgi:diguanylate cyclase (GGDEF)-like protein
VARPSRLLYERVVRVVAYLFIAAALVVVTVTQSWQQPLIYLLAAAGVVLVVVGQDMLPSAALGQRRLTLEALTMIVFVSILVVLTGGYTSPFFVGYLLVVGSASLWGGRRTPLMLAVVASVGYLLAVLATPLIYGSALPADALASVAFILVAIGLVAYVAAVISLEQRRSSEAALSLSRFDALTGLYSRSTFERALEQEVLRAGRTGRGFSLLLLDLDALKPVNDRYGHAAGDRLLAAIGDVMRGGVRATDLAARLGGDEFVVILPETEIAGALLVAEKLRHDIARLTLPTNGMMVSSSVSIGVVGFPDDGRGPAELLRRADQAMYQAKRQGKDQTFAYPRPAVAVAGSPETDVAGSPEGAPAGAAEVVIEGSAPWETGI